MNLLVLDGNSIVNRAFYGIKLLTTKSGYYTNAIYGFLNILLKLQDTCHPDGVAVAFDVHEPTFRHKQYANYKAGRKPMPQELRAQMPVLKELLTALGYTTVECPGWEADDVLGTLAAACRDSGDTCFIATGDRDALQLAHGGVKVLLARTKMGQAVTDVYDEAAIAAEYGITPQALIQVKALQGDSSDNIPGVAGVGAKTALDLVQRFGTLDAIYKDLDALDIKPGVREKLRRDKDKAYLSLDLGTIRTNAPIDAAPAHYAVTGGDPAAAVALFRKLELFSLIDKFNLDRDLVPGGEAEAPAPAHQPERLTCVDADDLLTRLRKAGNVYVVPQLAEGTVTDLFFPLGDTVFVMPADTPEFGYFVRTLLAEDTVRIFGYNTKELHRLAQKQGVRCGNICGDLQLSAYLLRPSDAKYDLAQLALEYNVPVPAYRNSLDQEEPAVALAVILPELFAKTDALIDDAGQRKLLTEIELPLAAKNELAEISFRQTRNAVLLEAQKKLIEISFCNRMIQELNTQLTDADSLVSIYETLLRNGSGNVLDVNRSKLNRAAIATEIRNTNAQKEVLLQELYGLNGGNTVSLSPEWSLSPLALPENFDSWFQQMETSVPELNYYQKDLELKKKSVRATKSEMIPSLSVGYTGEFTETERMQGFAIGMSIPLWENKNKVKKSKLDVEAAQSTASDARQRVYNNLKAQYVQSVELKKSLQMQQEALGNLNTIPLMKEALLKGEINLMDYLNEMTRYYDFRKNLLQTEKDYQTALADLHAFEL